MTIEQLNESSQKIINFDLKQIKFSVRKRYRQANKFDRLSCAWLETLHPRTDSKIKDILKLADGKYSYLDVAVAAMNEKSIKAKVIY